MTLHREVTNDTHVHRLVVTSDLDGWEVREEEDATVLHQARRHDWHRVELDVMLFELKTTAFTPRRAWAPSVGARR